MPNIRIKNLSVDYGEKAVIDTFSLDLDEPDFVAIVGLNGSGKSSLINSIANKIPYTGQIFLSDKFSYLGQRNNIGFPISVEELLLMGRFRDTHFSKQYSVEDRSLAKEYLSKFGLEAYIHKKFHELSGGEQQIVWIVQTLLQDLPIILLDEPTQQLDLKNKRKVFDILNEEVENSKKLILCVTHDIYTLKKYKGEHIKLF